MEMLYLGENLKYLRISRRLKYVDIEKSIGINSSGWSSYENGKAYPTLMTFIKIIELFKCNIDELVFAKLSEKESNHETFEVLPFVKHPWQLTANHPSQTAREDDFWDKRFDAIENRIEELKRLVESKNFCEGNG